MHKVIRMLAIVLALLTVSDLAFAQRRGGGGGRGGGGMRGGGYRGGGFSGRASARPNINRSMPRSNVSRPAQRPVNRGNLNTGNVNRGRVNTGDINRVGNINNIDRNVNIDRDWDSGWNWGSDGCCYGNPIARGVAWGAAAAVTAAAIGSTVYTLPSSCTTTIVDGVSYYSCDGSWYQPQFVGTTVEYVVVSPPQ
jgi:hypothetical protein